MALIQMTSHDSCCKIILVAKEWKWLQFDALYLYVESYDIFLVLIYVDFLFWQEFVV